jgi:hypothetical protein
MSLLYNDYVKISTTKFVCIVFMMLAHLTLEGQFHCLFQSYTTIEASIIFPRSECAGSVKIQARCIFMKQEAVSSAECDPRNTLILLLNVILEIHCYFWA